MKRSLPLVCVRTFLKPARLRSSAFVLFVLIMASHTMIGQESLEQSIRAHRYQLHVTQGRLSGPGADLLKKAIAEAQFVLIGEQHGTVETPEFIAAICDIAVPDGFHAIAVETGEATARKLDQFARSQDPKGEVAEFESKFSGAIPFYNLQEETSLLAHCTAADTQGRFHVWGLDQEYIGSARFLLTTLLATRPGKPAEAEIRKMLREENDAYKRVIETGNVEKSFLLSASFTDLEGLYQLVQQNGSPEARSLIKAFLQSRDIYQKNVHGQNSQSNRERAQLMKEAFLLHYKGGLCSTSKPPKVLFKFGATHLYRGLNPLHNYDLGNFVSELADGHGAKSLHIMMVGVRGEAATAGVPAHQLVPEKFDLEKESDPSIAFIKPFINMRVKDAWTIYDLRGLRGRGSISERDEELERLVFGYDLLVVVPEVTPARAILPTAAQRK
jgi:fructose-specific phosphotransferase system component IIB